MRAPASAVSSSTDAAARKVHYIYIRMQTMSDLDEDTTDDYPCGVSDMGCDYGEDYEDLEEVDSYLTGAQTVEGHHDPYQRAGRRECFSVLSIAEVEHFRDQNISKVAEEVLGADPVWARDVAAVLLRQMDWDAVKVTEALSTNSAKLLLDHQLLGPGKIVLCEDECDIMGPECAGSNCDMVQLACGDAACTGCVADHVKVTIRDGKSLNIRCMACEARLPDHLVPQLKLPPDTMQIFTKSLLHSYVDNNPLVKWCPSEKGCGNVVALRANTKLQLHAGSMPEEGEPSQVELKRYGHYYARPYCLYHCVLHGRYRANHDSELAARRGLAEEHQGRLQKIYQLLHDARIVIPSNDYLKEAWEELIKVRMALKWAYVVAFFAFDWRKDKNQPYKGFVIPEDNLKKTLFEDFQKSVEVFVERLSALVERDLKSIETATEAQEHIKNVSAVLQICCDQRLVCCNVSDFPPSVWIGKCNKIKPPVPLQSLVRAIKIDIRGPDWKPFYI
eukprot:gene1167-2673_t